MSPAERRPPDALLILFSVLALAVALTWLVPAGEFRREPLNGRQVVVAGSYQPVAPTPAPWHRLFTAPVAGFADRDTARIIAFVLLIGGAFGVVEATGAVAAGIGALARGAVRHPARRRWLVAALMLAFSIGGNTFGMSEEVLVFVLLTLGLARRMGWDPLTGVAIPFLGAGVGFSGAAFNPFTVGIAQGLSGLPLFSGWAFRMTMWATLTTITILYVLRHIARLEAARDAGTWRAPDRGAEPPALDGGRRAVLALFGLGIATLVLGVARWDWYIEELAGLFLGLAAGAALLGRMRPNQAAAAFADGARAMVAPALFVALSKAVLVVLQEGRVIDTLLQHASAGLGGLPPAVSAQGMFAVQFGINFLVPSGSGQAALTMPIMAPLADLLGIPRQAAVIAFQLGDGLCNFVIPTSGVTMGILAIAGIPFGAWLRWVAGLMLWLVGAGAVFLFLATTVVRW
jgi:uncharacterized ion transporter superfamily protein YfcC